MKKSFKEIQENIEFLKKLGYRELIGLYSNPIGMYLIENNEIVSCVDIETIEENKRLFLLSKGYSMGYYNGMKIK